MWGAVGCSATSAGGYGGYAIGKKTVSANSNLYICNGRAGYSTSSPYNKKVYAYNGGGYGQKIGGGCTHIATTNRGELYNYINNKNEVLIVAGGGGGSDYDAGTGGHGGGTVGTDSRKSEHNNIGGLGGTQTAGGAGYNNGSFGRGGDTYVTDDCGDAGSGGGGGWYGGGGSTNNANSGGGGSGYIGGVSNGSMKTGIWSGNGQTLITWMPIGYIRKLLI